MSVYKSHIWISDIDKIIGKFPELSMLEGKSVMITGACGLVCSPIIDILIRYNETHNEKVIIYAAGRNIEKIKNRFFEHFDTDYFKFIYYDSLKADNIFDISCDYIIHGAGNSSPDKIVKEPVETMLSNFVGMKYLLDFAKKYKIKRVLYISSSEVYGKRDDNKPYKENEYGYIDLMNPRNSYSIGKQATETLCISYADEYDVESVIVRPGHIYGPTAVSTDNHISSILVYEVMHGNDIIIKSDGSQIRSYCYCLDCASAILKVLLCGKDRNAYNISNPNSVISIKQMAEILAKLSGVQLRIEFASEDERKKFNPMSNSSLESVKLQKLGWKGHFDAKTGFAHTIQILTEMKNGGW